MQDSPLEFPCDYPVKVVGRDTAEFRAQVSAIIGDPPAGREHRIEQRLSRDGTYVTLTCTVHVGSRDELERLYQRLHATGLVLYAL